MAEEFGTPACVCACTHGPDKRKSGASSRLPSNSRLVPYEKLCACNSRFLPPTMGLRCKKKRHFALATPSLLHRRRRCPTKKKPLSVSNSRVLSPTTGLHEKLRQFLRHQVSAQDIPVFHNGVEMFYIWSTQKRLHGSKRVISARRKPVPRACVVGYVEIPGVYSTGTRVRTRVSPKTIRHGTRVH